MESPKSSLSSAVATEKDLTQVGWLIKYIDTRFEAIAEAVTKVEKSNDNYRAQQNEWRGQLSDQAQTFARREVLDQIQNANTEAREQVKKTFNEQMSTQKRAHDDMITLLDNRLNMLETKNANKEGRLYIIGIVWMLLVTIIGWYLNSKR